MIASQQKNEKGLTSYLRMFLCLFMAMVLAIGMTPLLPQAYAAGEDKPEKVIMQLGSQLHRTDVMKEVATLNANMGSEIVIPFEVYDQYSSLPNENKRRRLVLEDSSGKQTQVSESSSNMVGLKSEQLVAGQKVKLITLTKGKDDKDFVKRYEQQLNVRIIDTRSAEKKPTGSTASGTSNATAGISEDGGSWSFSNGLEYKFNNTGFKFLDGTTMNLGALKLPLKYKHNTDGTTIVGINCSPEDEAFFKAVKNGNVWQKYSSDAIAKKTAEMDKGWSGKKFGTWGGKSFDWNVCGYMEFNTKDPNAPRAVNLIISMGLRADGHAQYLCFTGTLTFTIGGKAVLVGKLTPGKGVEGTFNLGAYAGLELYIGVGLQYVASVGAYGKGQINIDFRVLPDFYLSNIKLSGELGAKAKAFGFTVYTWKILEGEKILYSDPDGKNRPPNGLKTQNDDGTATSPFTVDADTAYPTDSRSYLISGGIAATQSDDLTTQATKASTSTPKVATNENALSSLGSGGALTAAQIGDLTGQASTASTTILKGIYDQTELTCVTTNDGPVIAYIADAAQVGDNSRDASNRSALVYSRYKNGAWSTPKIVDSTATSGKYADYSPSICTDGDTCYISWLAADSKIENNATLGQVGGKLDVNVATVTKDDKITVETVCEESSENGTMPASPKAVKIGNDLYVGWYTNQTTGSNGEVIGVSGSHNIRLYKKSDAGWKKTSEVTSGQSGAITSFDVGSYGGTAACAWSIDEQFSSAQEEITLNGVKTLASSTVYCLTPDSTQAKIVAQGAANAQFAKSQGADVLTYAIRISLNDGVSNPSLYVQSSSAPSAADSVVLDGSKVYLPTPYYEITGDLGKGRAGNISFLKAGDGTSDIQALVTTGAGPDDWTSIVEATADTSVVTDYCATYADGKPLFVYTTESVSAASGEALTAQAGDDGAVDLNQTTDDSLKHLSVTNVDYDEYEVSAGQKMPVTVDFENDGMLDVSGTDLWVLDGGVATKVASNDTAVALDDEGSVSFEYTVPAKDTFSKAREFTVYAAPAGAVVTAEKIKREVTNGSATTISLGDASLSLETVHQIVDGQESIVATITNDGIAPHSAKLVFLDSDTGEELVTMDVPELGENETFTGSFDATNSYFQNDGIKNIIITLEDDGTEAEGYEINNTEFVSTWEFATQAETPSAADTPTTEEKKAASTASKSPSTGDQITMLLIFALLALACIATPIAMRAGRKK